MFTNNTNLGQRKLIYAGSNKKIYAASKDSIVIHYPAEIPNDVWRNYFCSLVWKYLSGMGIKNHFVQRLNLREQLVKSAATYPIFVKVYNIVPAEMCNRLGIEEGTKFESPLIEWKLKNRELGNPLISLDHIKHFNWLNDSDIDEIYRIVLRANDILQAYFYCHNMRLGSMTLEFGSIENNIVLVDEISPENCEFWDISITSQINKNDAYETIKSIVKQDQNNI